MPDRLVCPACRRPLREVLHRLVRVDVCNCGGMWFDRGELESWMRANKDARPPQRAAEVELEADPLPCPRCGVAALHARSVGAIHLSRCERCAGVWLPSEAVALLDPQEGAIGTGIASAVFEGIFSFLWYLPW